MPLSTGLAAAVVCAAASAWDVRTGRIPNRLTFGAAAVAIVFRFVTGGPSGAGDAVLGWLVGAAVFFPICALGGMGAGDVKLLAAVGAWLGPSAAAWTALYAAIAGAVMAVFVGLVRGYLRTAFVNLRNLLYSWWLAGVQPVGELTLEHTRGPRLAYAVAIAAGTVMTLWLR